MTPRARKRAGRCGHGYTANCGFCAAAKAREAIVAAAMQWYMNETGEAKPRSLNAPYMDLFRACLRLRKLEGRGVQTLLSEGSRLRAKLDKSLKGERTVTARDMRRKLEGRGGK